VSTFSGEDHSVIPFLRRMRSDVVGASILYATGLGVVGVGRFVLIPVYAKYLEPAQYGVLGLVNALVGILGMFVILGLDAAVAREFYDYRSKPKDFLSYIVTIAVFVVGVGGLGAVVLVTLGQPVLGWFFKEAPFPFYPFVPLGAALAAVTALLSLFMVLLQVRERAASYGLAQVARFAIMAVVTLVLFVGPGLRAEAPLIGDLAAIVAVVAILAVREVLHLTRQIELAGSGAKVNITHDKSVKGPERGKLRVISIHGLLALWDVKKLRGALAYGLPLIPHEMANWATQVSDRVILARFRSLEEVGIYSLGYSLASVMGVVVSAVNLAYVPYFYRTASQDRQAKTRFARNAEYYVMGVGTVCLVGVLFSKEVLTILTPDHYHDAAPVIQLVILGLFFQGLYLLTVVPIFYTKSTSRLPFLTAAAALLNIVLNLAIVPSYGIVGAAATTLVAYVVLFLLVERTARGIYPVPYNIFRFWGVIVLVTAIALTSAEFPLVLRVGTVLMFITLCIGICWGPTRWEALRG